MKDVFGADWAAFNDTIQNWAGGRDHDVKNAADIDGAAIGPNNAM
jgi:hypothetical protein